MALRTFTDSSGREWTVWDVTPPTVYSPVRSRADRRAQESAGLAVERRRGLDRRRRTLPPEMTYGWICFQCDQEKRRLTPPPESWTVCSDEELERLCRQAVRHRS